MSAFLRYTVLRILVFFGCVLLLWLLGLRDPGGERLLLVAGGALLSMVVSFFALKRFRLEYSAEVATTIERRTAARRAAGGTSDEDVEDAESAAPAAEPAREDDDFR